MAYSLRYYKDIAHDDGTVIRLEIYKKNGHDDAVEIGGVIQELSLQIQGQQGDIDTPIIKTSLSMTFVDADDIDDGRKNGFWEEFYTPDAVLWQVILKAKTAEETSFRAIWGGYVTPDSFCESLVYRGSVNIIARDNIGHLQDFTFDAKGDGYGMISLIDLVQTAWAKIESPMRLDWRGDQDEAIWMECNGVVAYDTLMNVTAFEGMNWYEAVEKALSSYGIVMRYVGNNIIQVSSLRYMPYQGRADKDSLPQVEPVFVSGANRELVPAIKRIEESVSYDLETSALMQGVEKERFTGQEATYRCAIEGIDMGYGKFGTAEHDAPVWPIAHGLGWGNVASSTLFFNPNKYEAGYFTKMKNLDEDIPRYTYIAANNVDERLVWFTADIQCSSDVIIRMKFGQPISLDSNECIELQDVFNLRRITFVIDIAQNGVTEYLGIDGGWRPDYQELTVDYDPSSSNFDFEYYVPIANHIGNASLAISIIKIEYAQTGYASKARYGLYACLQSLSFDNPESHPLLEKNNVNTLYNEENNVILRREPDFGPAYNSVTFPQYIKNGIFIYENGNIVPAKKWNWMYERQYQQMAVFNHLQLICYHGQPYNEVRGTIVNTDITRVARLYVWKSGYHLLLSGTLNFLNGYIENAVLREFQFYRDLWQDIPESDMPNAEEGGSYSSGGGNSTKTYNNTTTVTIGKGGNVAIDILNDWDAYNPSANQVLGANLGIDLYEWIEWIVGEGWGDSIDDIYDELNYIYEDINELDGRVAALEKNPGGGGIIVYEGITGISVNGQKYEDTDDDNVIVLPDYPTTVAELTDSADYAKVAELEAINDDIADLAERVGDVEDSITTLGSRIGDAEDDIVVLDGKVGDAEGKITALESQDEIISGIIEDISDDIAGIDSRLGVAENDILALQAEDERLAGLIEAVNTIAGMFSWDDEEHTRIRTDFDFFSKKTISSGGKAAPSGEGGGGSIDLSDYATIDYVDSNFLSLAGGHVEDVLSADEFYTAGDATVEGTLFADGALTALNINVRDITIDGILELDSGSAIITGGVTADEFTVNGIVVCDVVTVASLECTDELYASYVEIDTLSFGSSYIYIDHDGSGMLTIDCQALNVTGDLVAPVILDIYDRLGVIEDRLGI